jgi:hypothetical protein
VDLSQLHPVNRTRVVVLERTGVQYKPNGHSNGSTAHAS